MTGLKSIYIETIPKYPEFVPIPYPLDRPITIPRASHRNSPSELTFLHYIHLPYTLYYGSERATQDRLKTPYAHTSQPHAGTASRLLPLS